MFIYNLEVKNFKCLDNYNMPLQFDNLNVLIGENDSGKTSLLEAILIVFGEMKIEKSMFYDNRKEVKIKASFSDIEKQVLESTLSTLLIQGFNITHYELIRNFSNTYISPFIRADNEPEEIIGSYSFLEYIEEYLHVNRNYSFFNDLRDFYIAFLNNIFVTIEKTFYLKKDGEIESSETVYFEYPKNDFIERLVENLDFINYMETYLDKFDDRCKQILNEIIEDEGKFNLNALGNFYGLENEIYVIEDSGERFLNKEKYNKYLDDIRKIYCSTIISDDLEEAIFSKIAKLITVIINRNNCDKVSWDQVSNLRYNLTKEKDISIAAENIIGHHLISLKGFDGSLLPKNDGTIIAKNIINSIEIPEIKFFSTEVINKEVPAKLFDDIYNIKTLENTISEGLENFIKEELEDYVKEWYLSDDESDEFNEFHTGIKSSIVKYMAALNEKISDFDIKINFTDTNFDLLKQIVKPNIEINVKQNGQRVDITQKGQGFLRKLLLSDFLMLLKDYDKYFEKMADKILSSESDDKQIDKTIEENEISARRNRLIMIEEPEIHLHYSAQKKIMKMIKDNLEDSANQVFITTHSHFIIEDINFNDIYIFKKINNTGKTEISNLRNFKESPEILESLQSSLGLKKTDILNLIKLIVLVEGERDTV